MKSKVIKIAILVKSEQEFELINKSLFDNKLQSIFDEEQYKRIIILYKHRTTNANIYAYMSWDFYNPNLYKPGATPPYNYPLIKDAKSYIRNLKLKQLAKKLPT